MANSSTFQIDRIDTLIITVGTRQVGWRSKDGVVRCFGADGEHPGHINQLYKELGVERGTHEPGKPNMLWSVRDLGSRYHAHCQDWLGGDFSSVELLLDHKIIADSVAKGLHHIILWATNQPETVPWNYRRLDTCWLAQLMKGKIETTWPQVKVDVLELTVNANNRDSIREEFENFILPFALEVRKNSAMNDFVLLIENKGSVPAIAESLEICAAALVREFQVINASPIEPANLYQLCENGMFSAGLSQDYKLMPLSEYFWPLERSRVISAWKRGDFQEAQVWLSAHQSRHKSLYQLAGYLALSTNWEIVRFAENKQLENNWLRSPSVDELAGSEQVEQWQERLLKLRSNPGLQTWETVFLIQLQLERQNYTTAFMQFSQTVERLLYLRSQQENWLDNNIISRPPDFKSWKSYDPKFSDLIEGWCKLKKIHRSDKWYKLLHGIRLKRNDLIHHANPVTLREMRSLWSNNGFPVIISDSLEPLMALILEVLRKICPRHWQIPQETLLQSLYAWGLEILRSEVPST
ncbi:hypothetical protein J0895_24875 [Phormidium pseudopriestleyi FRX01]|uniref:Apea-like HEPN domain-containing protein n=1 Tax=Phormidium pseudopriestleyi FRX01 TaxID=1759528 RepID=A0ABS3G0X4_9CYAN|nr:hypothetical protein [Phormidium pseudopriestleyi]MBO0352257.1 hypothetical protein [Phormidium pseudopriestleyi FRX01]